MLDVARQALANAHAPYSRFRVGACLRAASGRLYAGCNVENAAYPVGQCAEATAIGAMVAAGDREIVEVVVVTEGRRALRALRPLPPAARRVRAAGRRPSTSPGRRACALTTTLGELLPLAFGREALGPRRPDGAAGA